MHNINYNNRITGYIYSIIFVMVLYIRAINIINQQYKHVILYSTMKLGYNHSFISKIFREVTVKAVMGKGGN